MRLLKRTSTGGVSLTEDLVDYSKIPAYAILSHTWGADIDEVTFKDLTSNIGHDKAGHKKIKFCGDQAAKDGLSYFWIDTCCIDKSNNTELSEAINSMYRWYQKAARCYVYLSDVSRNGFAMDDSSFQKSRWFTRGWTLQELLAPPSLEFFSVEGNRLGDKTSLQQDVHAITGISMQALQGTPPSQFSVSERMSWAKRRVTKREEDIAYCLLGLFDVSMPLIYGEGRRKAYHRLQREIDQAQREGLIPVSAEQQATRSWEPSFMEQLDGNPDSLEHCNRSSWNRKNGPRRGQTLSTFTKTEETQDSATWRDRWISVLKSLDASPYRDRKDRNPERVSGTCDWFVSHELFRDWRESESSRLLWVSADPGCGKSVLTKYLVDSFMPTTESKTVCYFFFKDDFDDQRKAVSALCCILRQIFIQRPILLSDAILNQFDIAGEQFTNSFNELWSILISVAEDKNAGEIICLLDAIDECEDQGRSELTRKLCHLYGVKSEFNLKFLVTSRPYGQIRRGFQPLDIPELPVIHLSGESEVEMRKISQEIDVFIQARIQDIGARLKLADDEQQLLLNELMRVPHRTYLWVHLTLDLVESDIDIDKFGIQKVTSQLPQTVDEAYDRILSKSRDSEKAKKVLHIVVAAERPLTLREMALALFLREAHRSHKDLEFRPEDRFREDVRDICGLFVVIIDSKIYLLHQTAKEFLLQNDRVIIPKGTLGNLKWKYTLQLRESHHILARICIWYLLLVESEIQPYDDRPSSQYKAQYLFLDYSAKHWATHLRESPSEIQDTMTQASLKLCKVEPDSSPVWFEIYWELMDSDVPQGLTALILASYLGLGTVVKHLIKMKGIDLNARDATHKRSALSWAADNGFEAVVKLLIKNANFRRRYFKLPFGSGAEIDSEDRYGRTPLIYAAIKGNIAVIKRLVKAGAQTNMEDEIGGTPFSYAICHGQEVAEVLLKRGTKRGFDRVNIDKLLISAVQKGHEDVVKLLLNNIDVDVNSRDFLGRTSLSYSAMDESVTITKLLLETSQVDFESRDSQGKTPLSWAAQYGCEAVVKLLLDTGKFDVDSRDSDGMTPLSVAAQYSSGEAVVKLLLETGKVDVNSRDPDGRTPLLWAAQYGREAVVKLLLDIGEVNVDSRDSDGNTPLIMAAQYSCEAVVKLLLETGKVDVNSRDSHGRTPLSWAAQYDSEAVVKLLLDTDKVDVDLKDSQGWTPLTQAARNGHEAVVKLLLEKEKVLVDARGLDRRTPLSWAVSSGNEAIVKLLLETGKADVDAKDSTGRAPVDWAYSSSHTPILRLLRPYDASST